MSKRGAEEYITKEHGSTPNSSLETNKVKMATAAQLAKRKMAVPKSRAGRTGQSPMPGGPPSNPFASTNTFGASQTTSPQVFQNPGGIIFGGASQSFPPADSSSNNGFNFSVPGQSSSFTFGQPAQNNPFASLNGNSSAQSPQSQDTNDITMESPQKKPAFGSGVFGANGNDSNKPSTGFTFGQTTSQPPSQPSFLFGQSQSFGGTASTPLFGQSDPKIQDSKPSGNLFGQSTNPQNETATTSTLFGQTSDQPQKQTQSPSPGFGQSTTPPPSSAPTFGFGQSTTSASSSAPTFSFGQPSVQPASNGLLFGGSSQVSQPAFGASAPSSEPAVSTRPSGSATGGSNNSIFGGFGSQKPAEITNSIEAAETPDLLKPSLFGQPSSSVSPEPSTSPSTAHIQPKANPFAGLFTQSTSKQPDSTTTPTADAQKPLFNFSKPAQSSGLFSIPKNAGEDASSKEHEAATKKSLFNFGTPASTPSSTWFSPSKAAAGPPASPNPFAGLSANKPESSEKISEQHMFGSAKDTVNKNGINVQASPVSDQTQSKPLADSDASASKTFSGFGKLQPSDSTASQKQALDGSGSQTTTLATPSFGDFAALKSTEVSKQTTDLFSSTSKLATGSLVPSSSFKQPETVDSSKRSVNTHPPSRIPPYLNGDEYKAYDSNYRLHSLNREFQKRIASLDPSRDDFENIMRNYVAARESIGESIGLYTRNIAGMKRKADERDDRRDDDGSFSVKRSKPAAESPAKSSFGLSQTSGSVFQPVPSSSSELSSTFMNTSSTKANTPAVFSTSSLFSSMIPNNSNTSSTPSSKNSFANLPKGDTAKASDTSVKPAFSLGGPADTSAPLGSTTPTKPPPKKPALEMPKFAAPTTGVNFMNAFKKQSEASAAKLAKEAKAKRKAEEFDSDEDDEEEWNKKYEEEERAKKAKVDAVAQKGFTPLFGNNPNSSEKTGFSFGGSANATAATSRPGSVFAFGNQDLGNSTDKPISISDNDASGEDDEDEASGDSGNAENEEEEDEEADEDEDLPEDDVNGGDEDEDEDLETTLAKSRNNGKSLFDRVTPNPTLQKDSTPTPAAASSVGKDPLQKPSVFGNVFGKGHPEAPSFSPLMPLGSKEPFVPSKTFNFTPTPPTTTSSPTPGASIFAGGAVRDGPITGEGLFGSRPSTPSNADKPKTNVFAGLGTPSTNVKSDQTWKEGSEIKFSPWKPDAPSVSITEPSPRKDESKPFANLFGATSSSAYGAPSNPSIGFSFGQSFAPGYLAATSHLTGGSGTNSGISSRATSPGTTDNESVATNEEDYANDAQVSLMTARPGEENEAVAFETRARAMRFYQADQIKGTKLNQGWNPVGLGIARLLKHKETGKTRLVMRAEPGANIILNTNLHPEIKYEYAPSGGAGTVKFNVVTNEGIQGWTLKMKTQQQGQDMAKHMEENKKSST